MKLNEKLFMEAEEEDELAFDEKDLNFDDVEDEADAETDDSIWDTVDVSQSLTSWISDLTTVELNVIQNYNNTIFDIKYAIKDGADIDESVIDILEEIIETENNNIGKLQGINMSYNSKAEEISSGEEYAMDMLSDVNTDEEEEDIEEAYNKNNRRSGMRRNGMSVYHENYLRRRNLYEADEEDTEDEEDTSDEDIESEEDTQSETITVSAVNIMDGEEGEAPHDTEIDPATINYLVSLGRGKSNIETDEATYLVKMGIDKLMMQIEDESDTNLIKLEVKDITAKMQEPEEDEEEEEEITEAKEDEEDDDTPTIVVAINISNIGNVEDAEDGTSVMYLNSGAIFSVDMSAEELQNQIDEANEIPEGEEETEEKTDDEDMDDEEELIINAPEDYEEESDDEDDDIDETLYLEPKDDEDEEDMDEVLLYLKPTDDDEESDDDIEENYYKNYKRSYRTMESRRPSRMTEGRRTARPSRISEGRRMADRPVSRTRTMSRSRRPLGEGRTARESDSMARRSRVRATRPSVVSESLRRRRAIETIRERQRVRESIERDRRPMMSRSREDMARHQRMVESIRRRRAMENMRERRINESRMRKGCGRNYRRFTEAQGSRYDGAERIYSGEGYDVYKIMTPEAAKEYGRNTKWCISERDCGYGNRGEAWFNRYIDNGVKAFYFIIPQGSQRGKYCYVDYGTNGFFWDEDDRRIKASEIEDVLPASVIDSLPGVYMTEGYRRFTEARKSMRASRPVRTSRRSEIGEGVETARLCPVSGKIVKRCKGTSCASGKDINVDREYRPSSLRKSPKVESMRRSRATRNTYRRG